MQSVKRSDLEVVIHWPCGPVLTGSGGSPSSLPDRAAVGALRSYLRDLAQGRR